MSVSCGLPITMIVTKKVRHDACISMYYTGDERRNSSENSHWGRPPWSNCLTTFKVPSVFID